MNDRGSGWSGMTPKEYWALSEVERARMAYLSALERAGQADAWAREVEAATSLFDRRPDWYLSQLGDA